MQDTRTSGAAGSPSSRKATLARRDDLQVPLGDMTPVPGDPPRKG
jgi:hypothetical protein